MEYLSIPFGYVMRFCYNLLSNYGLAIILFTLLSKIILFPISLWTHKNSIKLVKLQPEINFIKAKYYGDNDRISDLQLELYKREHYHAMAGLIPMVIQIILLMAVIGIIYSPLRNILGFNSTQIGDIVTEVCTQFNLDAQSNSIQLSVIEQVQNGFDVGEYTQSIRSLDLKFLGFDLSLIPIKAKGKMLLVPLFAGISALALCLFQNKMNPLQAQQSKISQFSTNAVSVGISLILGGFVPAGIGLYWMCSNIFTMFQQLILNAVINPKKNIDYNALEESKLQLEKINEIGKKNKPTKEQLKKEKSDYKRFFSVANKHLVVYAEAQGFYRYFSHIIDYILTHSNIIIHYITSDPNDKILKNNSDRIKTYYFSEKRMITVLMKMDADIVLMTTPDLDNYHYKRSYVKKDIEYIYVGHGISSLHMVVNNHAFDNFDTIFCIGQFWADETRRQEELYNLKPKNLILAGYGAVEEMAEKFSKMQVNSNSRKILIAPSWQEDNILDTCIEALLDELMGNGFDIHIRPHPEYAKRYKARLDAIVEKYSKYEGAGLTFELDFSDTDSLYNSDILITDWSTSAMEFSFATLKPSIFINTPPKILNKDYKELGIEPIEISIRDKIGRQYPMDNFDSMSDDINYMIEHSQETAQRCLSARNKYIANFGESGKIGGRYIINQLISKQKEQKNQ